MDKLVKILAIFSETEEIGKNIPSSKLKWSWKFTIDNFAHHVSVIYSKITGKLKIYIDEKLTFKEIKKEVFKYAVYVQHTLILFDFQINHCDLKIDNADFNSYCPIKNKEEICILGKSLFKEKAIYYSDFITPSFNSNEINKFQETEIILSPINCTTNNPFSNINNEDDIIDVTPIGNSASGVLNDTTQLSENIMNSSSPFHFNIDN